MGVDMNAIRIGFLSALLILGLAACGGSNGYGSSGSASPTKAPTGASSGSNGGYSRYGGSGGSTGSTAGKGKNKIVANEVSGKYGFAPTSETVKAGTTVTWTNTSNAPHTVTSDQSGMFGKNLAPDKSITITFSKPGTYRYHCTIHTYMHGAIVVQ